MCFAARREIEIWAYLIPLISTVIAMLGLWIVH